ncbi:NAD(P)-binding protein [Daldinia vernicosa]|uniref:NAD(P)-binding protein n=1 Tax=Daldinia vernicosa TaxID=114800 RepID=UPI002008086F|nr:NAD(P)-binding protein [Daldinia vernicosa]KAI0854019.1 NAD(P)-binding protein [Daldinia vernicosa]
MAKGSILVTGANGGLGSAIVDQILHRPSLAQDYHGLYTVRKVENADTVRKVLQRAGKVNHHYDLVPLDLASLASVRRVAADINSRVSSGEIPPIRALILSAAYQEHGQHDFSKDGFDMSFQASYLSHFLLTLLLLQSMDKEKGRILVLGSWAHDTTDARNKVGPFADSYMPEEFHQIFNDPEGSTEAVAKGKWGVAAGQTEDPVAGMRRYGAAKLCEVMMMRELARRISKDPTLSKIAVLGLDPAAMMSGISRRSGWLVRIVIMNIMGLFAPLVTWLNPNGSLRTTWKSAGDVIHACFDTDGGLGEYPNGLYLNGTEISDVGPEAKDETKCRRLWRDSLEYANIKEGDTVLADWR